MATAIGLGRRGLVFIKPLGFTRSLSGKPTASGSRGLLNPASYNSNVSLNGSTSLRRTRTSTIQPFGTRQMSMMNKFTQNSSRPGFKSKYSSRWSFFFFKPPPRPLLFLVPIGVAYASTSSLNTTIELDEEANEESEMRTDEERFLEDSLAQNEKRLQSNRSELWWLLRENVYEPLVTCVRFFHLAALFVPLLLLLPLAVLDLQFGPRGGRVMMFFYKSLAFTMETAGPSFIKLGQWAASRTDIFSPGFCDIMSKLHSNNKPHSIEYTKESIKNEFGLEFDELFEEFNETPVGVGAMGQVYIAKVRPPTEQSRQNSKERGFFVNDRILRIDDEASGDGHNNNNEIMTVAVKVLHPKVRRLVERDLKIMAVFAQIINYLPTMEWLSLPGEVATFKTMMLLQLDLQIEAKNLVKFGENFRKRFDTNTAFPVPFLASEQILIEEYIDAVPLDIVLLHSKVEGLRLNQDLAGLGLDAFLKMLLLDNFTHSDLHPGNIMVRFQKSSSGGSNVSKFFHRNREEEVDKAFKEARSHQDIIEKVKSLADASDSDWSAAINELYDQGYRPQICFIDAGLVTQLNEVNRRNFLDLFKAISVFDGYRVGELMVERSRTPETAIEPDVFALKVQRLVYNIKQRTFALGSVKLGDLLTKVLAMVRQHHIRMESDFITVVLSILLLEGIGRQLDGSMDLFKSSIPILRQLGAHEAKLDEDTLSMAKVWLALEVRQFINASIQDIHKLVKHDGLSPNQ